MTTGPLRISVVDLLASTGSRDHLERTVALDGLRVVDTVVTTEPGIALDLSLQSMPDGIAITGGLRAPWTSVCRRCLTPVSGTLEATVGELFEAEPTEGETYPVDDDEIDLEPMVHDVVLLDLPPAPLCRPDCAGLCPQCGIDRNTATCECADDDTDPRWDALSELTFDDDAAS